MNGPTLGLRRRRDPFLVEGNSSSNDEYDDDDDDEGRYVEDEQILQDDPRNETAPSEENETARFRQENINNARRGRTTTTPPWLSGSIGIGVFKISKWYCLASILSAVLAIVLAPIPDHIYNQHDWTRSAKSKEKSASDFVLLEKQCVEKSEDDAAGFTPHWNYLGGAPWSMEDTFAPAAVTSTSSLQCSNEEPSSVPKNQINNVEKEPTRKRRRRPAGSEQQQHSNTEANAETGNEKDDLSTSWWRYWVEPSIKHLEDKLTETPIRQKKENETPPTSKPKHTLVWWKDKEDDSLESKSQDDERSPMATNNDQKASLEPLNHTDTATEEDVFQWIDPVLWTYDSFPEMMTKIIDKILKSTIRLCILTNFMMTMTYLLHSVVAAWFLSHSNDTSSQSGERNTNVTRQQQQQRRRQQEQDDDATTRIIDEVVTDWSFVSSSPAAPGSRERMGGFLAFKLLLISAVVTPDTLDVLILLTWFTLLGCLKSLDHLAHSTNTHLTEMGQPPNTGVVRLLFWVLGCVCVSAGSCVALFHTAGIGMVLLLTCDCAHLGAVVISHILKYYQCVLDDSHDRAIRGLEERQLELHCAHGENDQHDAANNDDDEDSEVFVVVGMEHGSPSRMTQAEIREESGRLEREMEGLELIHGQRFSILETGIFGLEMACHLLTVAHFCHIWSLHGVQFTLIDGVLALQLHSAISMSASKLARRRTVHNISRNLHGRFPNATDEELKNASTAGDVCCICLRSMSWGGNVKKVHCGHLFHTQCLREVIERASNLQSAKCPLCRASLLDSTVCHPVSSTHNNNNNNNTDTNHPELEQQHQNNGAAQDTANDRQQVDGERALFRFSTEGMLPVWLPIPAFSFEVVRRPPNGGAQAQPPPPPNEPIQAAPDPPTRNEREGIGNNNDDDELQEPDPRGEQQGTFFHRFLVLTGLMPMSPEEEARAIEQLVDMFPQYDRGDLLRELRDRGSIEAVAEVILLGIFRGVPRGED